MRLPDSEHTDRPWRIHEIAPDFQLEDVWSYRAPGAGPDDFHPMLDAIRTGASFEGGSRAARFLFAVRWKLGALLGWDEPEPTAKRHNPSLRDRLPEDLLRETPEAVPDGPFTRVFQRHDECALELDNRTVHGICHLGWVATDDGYELRMAVLVKPNGRFGELYMAAIKPFRYLIVYPAMTRQWEQAWVDHGRASSPDPTAPPERTRYRRGSRPALSRTARLRDEKGERP